MEDRIEILRRRIDLYRRYVAVGPDVAVIRLYKYLIEITEEELREIEAREQPEQDADSRGKSD